jgi:hypothetical protein
MKLGDRRTLARGVCAIIQRLPIPAANRRGRATTLNERPSAILEKIGTSGDLAEATHALNKLNGEVDRLTAARAHTPDTVA